MMKPFDIFVSLILFDRTASEQMRGKRGNDMQQRAMGCNRPASTTART